MLYSSGQGSRAGSLTPEPAFCKPAPSKEDAKQLKEEMNEQHAKLYTKLKVNNYFKNRNHVIHYVEKWTVVIACMQGLRIAFGFVGFGIKCSDSATAAVHE